MSQDQLDALLTRLASDPTFAASLAAATTVEDAQQNRSQARIRRHLYRTDCGNIEWQPVRR